MQNLDISDPKHFRIQEDSALQGFGRARIYIEGTRDQADIEELALLAVASSGFRRILLFTFSGPPVNNLASLDLTKYRSDEPLLAKIMLVNKGQWAVERFTPVGSGILAS